MENLPYSNPIVPSGQTPAPVPTSDERTMALLSHLLTLFFWIFPPLIIYLVKKDESAYVSQHAKESLNFQITMTLIGILLFITIIGILLLWALALLILVLVIVATIKASENKVYRYPMTIRFIK